MPISARYEVLLVCSESSLTTSEWTWRRLERDDSVSARGLRHGAINGCFCEIREHKRLFGDATVTVNLSGENRPRDAAPTAPVATSRVRSAAGAALVNGWSRPALRGGL